MSDTKKCLPEPIDGFIHLEPGVSYSCTQVLPVGVKIKLLPIDKAHKEQMVKV